jgi:twitching motility protein PilU
MLTDDQAMAYMHKLLTAMAQAGGSDLFISAGSPPTMKAHGALAPLSQQKLNPEVTRVLARSIMNDRQRIEFDREMESNFAIVVPEISRFRVNVYVQQTHVAMVIRTIANEIPNADKLGLPPVLKELILSKRGLLLIVGGTGSGKSTTLAALIDHRNATTSGHIITVEDPIEYVHEPKKSLVSHREVGVDTHSWEAALKNALRQAPDVILMGEVRDRETMEHAITFSETGHLCLATLHANSANQAIDRIINFFPEERRAQLLMDLSANLRGIVSQRLIRTEDGKGRKAAIEIMINTPTIADKIFKGQFHEIKPLMERGREAGMRTFDWALFDLYNRGLISYDEALRNADSSNELRLNIKLRSQRGAPAAGIGSEPDLSFDQGGPAVPDLQKARREELERQEMRRREFEQKQGELARVGKRVP